MKVVNVFLMLMLISMVSFAQEANDYGTTRVISGAVIDKKGNPIPGAIVRAAGGAEYVTTDADGSFSIEVPLWLKSLNASYPGYGEKTFKLGEAPYALITLSKRESKWFVNAVYNLTISDGKGILNKVGVMGGLLNDWGGYAKVLMPIYSNGEERYPTVAIGVIKKIEPIYVYLGAGYTRTYTDYDGWVGMGSVMVDCGVIYRIKDFDVNLGYSYSSKYGLANHSIQLSAGYCF